MLTLNTRYVQLYLRPGVALGRGKIGFLSPQFPICSTGWEGQVIHYPIHKELLLCSQNWDLGIVIPFLSLLQRGIFCIAKGLAQIVAASVIILDPGASLACGWMQTKLWQSLDLFFWLSGLQTNASLVGKQCLHTRRRLQVKNTSRWDNRKNPVILLPSR